MLDYYTDVQSSCEPASVVQLVWFYIQGVYDWLYAQAKGSIFIYPLLLSVMAAYIFYLFFTVLPFKRKKNKILPLMNVELYLLNVNLSQMFGEAMRPTLLNYSGKYSSIIVGGGLTEDMLNRALHGRCLNGSVLTSPRLPVRLVPIGPMFIHIIEEAEAVINRAQQYDQFILPEEMILLEEIRHKLKEVILNRDASHDIVVNCDYLSGWLYPLYQLYMRLQQSVYSQKRGSRDWSIGKGVYLYSMGDFKSCIRFCGVARKNYPDDYKVFTLLLLQCEFALGHLKRFRNHLKDALSSNSLYDPMSGRGLISLIKDDAEAMKMLEDSFGIDKVRAALAELDRERGCAEEFERSIDKLVIIFKEIADQHINRPR